MTADDSFDSAARGRSRSTAFHHFAPQILQGAGGCFLPRANGMNGMTVNDRNDGHVIFFSACLFLRNAKRDTTTARDQIMRRVN